MTRGATQRDEPMTKGAPTPTVWQPFVAASIGAALTGGFLLGGSLFAARLAGIAPGAWWIAAGQAHGQVQLFGWAGLIVLGVAFHFVPRFAGVPLAAVGAARWVLGLMLGGLQLRVLCQPLVAAEGQLLPRIGLLASGPLLLAGGTLAVAMLVRTMWDGASRKRSALRPVRPLFFSAFLGLWLALALSAIGSITAWETGFVEARLNEATLLIAFYGFLLPIAVAMAVRTFPLYFQTPPAIHRLLLPGLGLVLAGTALRIVASGGSGIEGMARLAQSLGVILLIVAVRVFARRRPLPRRPSRPLRDPLQLHVITAFLWLAFGMALLLGAGLRQVGVGLVPTLPDAEYHALGAGFITLLILGVGSHMLPGFGRRELRHPVIAWATLVLANFAVLGRVGLGLRGAMPGEVMLAIGALSGLLGMGAVALFAVNITGPRRRGPSSSSGTVRRDSSAPVR